MSFGRLFSTERRISRIGYWLSLLITCALLCACFIIPGTIAFITEKRGMDSGFLHYLPGIVWFMQVIPLGLYMRGVISGRLQDMNSSGCLFRILWFIPIMGWLTALILLGILPSKPKTKEEVFLDELENSESKIDELL